MRELATETQGGEGGNYVGFLVVRGGQGWSSAGFSVICRLLVDLYLSGGHEKDLGCNLYASVGACASVSHCGRVRCMARVSRRLFWTGFATWVAVN